MPHTTCPKMPYGESVPHLPPAILPGGKRATWAATTLCVQLFCYQQWMGFIITVQRKLLLFYSNGGGQH